MKRTSRGKTRHSNKSKTFQALWNRRRPKKEFTKAEVARSFDFLKTSYSNYVEDPNLTIPRLSREKRRADWLHWAGEFTQILNFAGKFTRDMKNFLESKVKGEEMTDGDLKLKNILAVCFSAAKCIELVILICLNIVVWLC